MFDAKAAAAPDPAGGYDDAMAKAARLLELDDDQIAPVCVSRVLDHGRRTPEAVVLMHGYTSCPRQWAVVGEAMARDGRSVVIPRLPGHGYGDRMTRALSHIHPEDLKAAAHAAVDVAAGLGERVTVVGLSGGGTLAAWLAAGRDDVAEAVLIAPLIVPKVVPEQLSGALSRFPGHGVDIFLWWDPHVREGLAAPPYAYPRYSVRSLAALLSVGREAGRVTRTVPLQRLTAITNDNDAAVSNHAVAEVADALTVVARERRDLVFGADRGFQHDIIDPAGECAGSDRRDLR